MSQIAARQRRQSYLKKMSSSSVIQGMMNRLQFAVHAVRVYAVPCGQCVEQCMCTQCGVGSAWSSAGARSEAEAI